MPSRASSLRLKLATWFVLVFFAIQATLMLGVLFFRRDMIETAQNNSLTESATAMIDSILATEADWGELDLASLVPEGADFTLYAIRAEDDRILVPAKVPDGESLPFTPTQKIPAGPLGGVHTTIKPDLAERLTGDDGALRMISLPFRRNDEVYYFLAAAPSRALDRRIGPLADLLLPGVPIGVLAALIASWFIAGRAVRPMEELSRAARDVSPKSLSERFEVETRDAEVKGLEHELNSALERIEAGYRAQDQFISNVSHELRTPVAVLLTQAQVAKMGERDVDKSYAFVDKAETLLKRLGRLVESFLVLARAELTETRSRDVVPVVDLVLGCLHSCREYADQNGVRLLSSLDESDDDEMQVTGDGELLLTMVENLVRNAISHSPLDGEVTLRAERDNGAVLLSVRDEGPGIPDDYVDRVFDRFVQVPKSSSRTDGTGLGLAIADGVAKLHDGSISVANNESRGCTFTVRLPRA